MSRALLPVTARIGPARVVDLRYGAELVKHALSNAKRFGDLQLDAQRLDRRLQIDIDEEEVKGVCLGSRGLPRNRRSSNARMHTLRSSCLLSPRPNGEAVRSADVATATEKES